MSEKRVIGMSVLNKIIKKKLYNERKILKRLNKYLLKQFFGLEGEYIIKNIIRKSINLSLYDTYHFIIILEDIAVGVGEVIRLPIKDIYYLKLYNKGEDLFLSNKKIYSKYNLIIDLKDVDKKFRDDCLKVLYFYV